MRPVHLLLLLLINLSWGFNIVPAKLALVEMPPMTAALVRFLMVAVMCAPAMRWHAGQMGPVFGYALIGGVLMFGFGNAAIASAHNVSAIAIAGQLSVPFSLILAIMFLGERIRLLRMLGILLAFGGVLLISFAPGIFAERIALLLSVVGSFAHAVGTILLRRLRGVPPLSLQSWLAVISIGPFLLASLVFEPGAIARLPTLGLHIYGYLFVSALLASVVGHALLAYLLQRYPITLIAPLTLLAPLLAVVFSVMFLDNALTAQLVSGGLITLVGVGIITFRNAQKSTE